jgi:hypothetical protein
VGDAWNIRLDAVAELLDSIASTRERAIVLTGDIHYAGAMEFNYQTSNGNSTQIVQFTASACKNEELLTKIIQSKLKTWLVPELVRTCVGTFTPPRMQWQPFLLPNLDRYFRPDWRGKLRLTRYQPIEMDKKYPISGNIWMRFSRLIRRYYYNGGEVIGFNNIAVVGWNRVLDRDAAIGQDVYWIDCRAPTADFPLSIARYQIAISPVLLRQLQRSLE